MLAPVVVPGAELLLVGGGALQGEAPLHFCTTRSIPIFFHCSRIISAICVNCKNWPPSVMISRRNRPLPSVRSRKPSPSFLANPTLSSISLAF